MPYQTKATGVTPALVIYLLDCSGSMSEQLDGAEKIDHVNQAVDRVLTRMVRRSTKGEIVSPRYRLSMIAYSERPIDLLGGISTIDKVIQKGKPKLTTISTTEAAAAFAYARDLLKRELPNLKGFPAPMICHLTDGQFTGPDPEPIAREIMQMSNDDGPILIENIYVGPDLTHQPIGDAQAWQGITDENELKDPYAKKLFRMSSTLPDSYAEVVADEGYSLRSGSRMLIPGTNKELIELAFAMSGATPVI
jgi:hypothetical protein